ncbi:MAG TPA: hypothetical protein DCQ06_10565 [Myxococcales bacterium]|nr:hypothetical protein [Myxococcales bacterium]HAN32028.1 hypothetical protein [Myxococcales bacterium]|tara:strand:+ start:1571 stop:2386 length:816 start_codon:yes stop_codon:yes gene_type:complete
MDRLTRVLTYVIALAMLSGCEHENPLSLELEGNVQMVRMPGAVQGISAVCMPQMEIDLRPAGVMDLMVTNSYVFFPRMENKMQMQTIINQATPQNLVLDAHTVTIEGAEMTLEANTTAGPLAGAPLQNTSWNTPFSAQLEPAEFKGSRFTLIPPNVGDELRNRFSGQYTAMQRILIDIKLYAKMADGTRLQSNTLRYPIDLCWGCLVSLPFSQPGVGLDPEQTFSVCNTKLVDPLFTPPCMPGNDEYLPCTFYCFMCDQDSSCDEQFCPNP